MARYKWHPEAAVERIEGIAEGRAARRRSAKPFIGGMRVASGPAYPRQARLPGPFLAGRLRALGATTVLAEDWGTVVVKVLEDLAARVRSGQIRPPRKVNLSAVAVLESVLEVLRAGNAVGN
jgi:hypothetical protein